MKIENLKRNFMKEFKNSEIVDIEKMRKINFELREVLKNLYFKKIPNNYDYNLKELEHFCFSLLKGQRNADNLPNIKPGSWCVAPNSDYMDGEARGEFIFYPTYIAVAILTKMKINYPNFTSQIKNYDEILKLGMQFSTYRELSGHGYNGFNETINNIIILGEGSVYQFLLNNPEYCPELLLLLKK